MTERVCGFDLDMTLIDTAPGFAATLAALGAELDITFPVEQMSSRLGPPLPLLLKEHLAAERIDSAVDRFRELYVDHAIAGTLPLRGAHAALAAVRRLGGRSVLVTGKFTANAQRHVDHLGFELDHVEGEVWGVGKADILRRKGASVFVGDHVHDVEGALAAGITSVSVLTGGCTADELREAGTHVVLEDLTRFPGWLRSHWLPMVTTE